MTKDELLTFRDRLYMQDQIPDEALEAKEPPYFHPGTDSPEYEYMMQRRRALDGSLPRRVTRAKPIPQPAPDIFTEFNAGSAKQAVSTTMVFTRLLRSLLRDDDMGARVVPIIPDEARTFGMDGLFKEVKIDAPFGQLYDPDDVFYYLTLYNENYVQPAMPADIGDGITRGVYRFAAAPDGCSHRATILFSGTAQGAARDAQQLLAEHHDVGAELWSATSYKSLREEALSTERWNRLHPTDQARVPYVTERLSDAEGPFVAVTDFMKAVPDQVARWVPGTFIPLGTDGYGRSDTRAALRHHFETDAPNVVVAVLQALAQSGEGKQEAVADAIARYELDTEAVDPRLA